MPYDDEDGPTAAELAYEQSLEDYKRQTGKTPKNADTSRHRSERTPNRRPRPQDRSGGRRPPPRERSRSKSRQDILDAEARSAKRLGTGEDARFAEGGVGLLPAG